MPFSRTPHLARAAVSLVVVLFVLVGAGISAAQMVGSAHDFVDDGFTGGGVCAACHVPHGAEADRLWVRTPGLGAPVDRLCLDCHEDSDVSGCGDMPTGPGWPVAWDYTNHCPPPLRYDHYAGTGIDPDTNSGNGHGKATGQSQPMRLSCVAGNGPQGCHTMHQPTTNRYLIDPLFDPATTVGEFGEMCLSCHTPGLVEGFHNFGGHYDEDGVRPFNSTPNATVVYKPVGGPATTILPFFVNATDMIDVRWFRDATHPQVGADSIMCLTCHNPHGTATTAHTNEFGETVDVSQNTRGMLRKFPVEWLGDVTNDALCGECHVQ